MSGETKSKLKVAIVHDWLYGGGAERVVLELHRMFPDAPIYTSYCSDEWRQKLDGKVVTGYLQRWPFSKLRKFLAVLRIWWFTRLDFSGYDLVISSSGNGEAFGIKTPKETVHINYCHTPTHYYWRFYDEYMKQPGFGIFNPLARLGLKLLLGPLRKWDYRAAQRADYFIANSAHIQADIQTYYERDAIVIHPSIDVARFDVPEPPERTGFVIAGRHVPQKRMDLAVIACTKLGLPLTVVGDGPERKRLMRLAGPTITFTGRVSDTDMPHYLAAAQAFIFPSFEDLGIVPIEAMAAGTPVIAYRAGGALEYVEEGKTGILFDKQTVPSLRKALRTFDPKHFKRHTIKAKAQEFSPEVFRKHMNTFIQQKL
jgi:glycosyltransferase involved in cell wall biosynthesis